jgi:AcrR family transcriptional regulator
MPAAEMSKKRIYDAAIRLFAERGVTPVTISELASAAGVARGTIYNNLDEPGELFAEIAGRMASEMHERVAASFELVDDPARRLANGLRFFVRRAHEEPHWGRFVVRFAFSDAALQGMWNGRPARDLEAGLAAGRYDFVRSQMPSVIAMIAAVGFSAMFLVLEGHKTWREAGSDAAVFALRALGIGAAEAQALAQADLPPLPPLE